MSFTTRPATFIYVIQAHETDRIKIGFSRSPVLRVTELQTGSPFLLSLYRQWPGTIELEQEIHREFEPLRKIGEWFSLPAGGFTELIDRIEKVIARFNEPERVEFREAQSDYGHMKEWAFDFFVRLRPKTKFIREFNPQTPEQYKTKRRGELKCNEIKILLLVGNKDEAVRVESEIDKVINKLGCLSQMAEAKENA